MPDFTYKLISFKAIALGGDGLTPMAKCVSSRYPKGYGGQRGGKAPHQRAKLMRPAHCSKYPSCFECLETDCNWDF